MKILFVQEAVIYFVMFEDLAEYFANLRAIREDNKLDNGEFRTMWFNDGVESGSIFLIQNRQTDTEIMNQFATTNESSGKWFAAQLFDPHDLVSKAKPLPT